MREKQEASIGTYQTRLTIAPSFACWGSLSLSLSLSLFPYVLGHSINSNCSTVGISHGDHHGRKSHKLVQHWLSEKSHQRSFLAETWSRTAMFDDSPGEQIRFLSGAVHIIQTQTSFKMLKVHPSGRVAIPSIKLEMLLFEFFLAQGETLFFPDTIGSYARLD